MKTQYIDKAAIVAELEKRLNANGAFDEAGDIAWTEEGGMRFAYKSILSFIDTLEVKEMDFIKEFYTFSEKHKLMDKDIEFSDIEKTASFFFQLGLKAQKGEQYE